MPRDRVRARVEPSLGARVTARTPLFYTRGADRSVDRPAHVRAGSALVDLGSGRLAVVQDDASFVAVVDVASGLVRDVPLPSEDGVRLFDDTRGNKKRKLDLEAAIALDDDLLVAFGSGSTSAREHVVVVRKARELAPVVEVLHARELYAAMRAARELSGSELNIEGVAVSGDDVVLFNRGNGAKLGGVEPVDATARVSRASLAAYLRALAAGAEASAPLLRDIVAWDLGEVAGTRLTFTDAAALAGGGGCAFLACAEACPDATRDGPVVGVAIGRLDDGARRAELAMVRDERGEPLLDKAEGLAFDARAASRAFVVVDKDDPAIPSELLELALDEGWLR